MKVILNNDVPDLGELGDVKDVAAGYARNFLLPRGLVYPYSPAAIALFAKRKAEIDARKSEKRASSADLKTRLEADDLVPVVDEQPAALVVDDEANRTGFRDLAHQLAIDVDENRTLPAILVGKHRRDTKRCDAHQCRGDECCCGAEAGVGLHVVNLRLERQ